MNEQEIMECARDVFQRELKAIEATRDMLGKGLVSTVKSILESRGKVVTMGIGKSGLIARKIAATRASTGTSAIFVHPVECLHGDMGIINQEDLAFILSKSGESDEMHKLLMFLRNRRIKIIAVTTRPRSHLGRNADIVIPYRVPKEACPMGMAPMASTTVQMVIGDAIAAVLIKLHDFKPNDFAMFHPSGSLGKQLLLKVSDLMHTDDDIPEVLMGTPMKDALLIMTAKAMGAILIMDDNRELKGIITDGDLRRGIQSYGNLLDMPVQELMVENPVSVHENDQAIDALHLMEKRISQIAILPVVDNDLKIQGILRLHDLVLAGL